MVLSESEIELLAEILISERSKEIEGQYFSEVNQKIYQKYFGHGPKGQAPYLDEYRHGGRIIEDEDGTYHFYMISRKLYKMRKKGKHFRPDRKQMSQAVREAYSLSMNMIDADVAKSSDGKTMSVRLYYKNLPPEYKGSYSAKGYYHDKWISEDKQGKMSSLDRLICKAIGKWSDRVGKEVIIESSYEGD